MVCYVSVCLCGVVILVCVLEGCFKVEFGVLLLGIEILIDWMFLVRVFSFFIGLDLFSKIFFCGELFYLGELFNLGELIIEVFFCLEFL